ncbi:thiamine pyrophosphate-dependent enzyme [Dehalococcoidia bacterium]|nr:thiamine pyrophosphate-dependent enzyme [Dehalococcoidia bacterium]
MIESEAVFKAFQEHRGKAIVMVNGRAGRHWSDISTVANRDVTIGGAMGQKVSTAFGLALGLPDQKIVMFDSEGSLLMNLGVLSSVAGKKPRNFYHFLLDNECYATTGGQPVPNAQEINYAGMAREAGYAATHEFDDLEDFVTNIGSIMKEEGPVFIAVKIYPEVENLPMGLRTRRPGRSQADTIRDLQKELGISNEWDNLAS